MEREHSDSLPSVACVSMRFGGSAAKPTRGWGARGQGARGRTVYKHPPRHPPGAMLWGQAAFVWPVRARFSPTSGAARSSHGQRQGCDGLAEAAASSGFACFTFKQYSGQGVRARSFTVSEK